jgi:hypothetical protein
MGDIYPSGHHGLVMFYGPLERPFMGQVRGPPWGTSARRNQERAMKMLHDHEDF